MKCKKILGLSLLVVTMTLAGCAKSEPTDESFKTTANFELNTMINDSKDHYDLSVGYEDNFFLSDSEKYNKGLSVLSYSTALVSETAVKGKAFFETIQFKDITPVCYDVTPTKDTAAYILAHKSIAEYEVFAVSFRSTDYRSEWANNFLIGESGDHEGFALRANDASIELHRYIANHAGNRPVKIWITGYSRGGALANALANMLLRSNSFGIRGRDRLYAYTFEAPNCLAECVEYTCVHNVVNRADIVAQIPPTHYGLGKCGVTHYIEGLDTASVVHAFDEGITFPEFAVIGEGDEAIENETQLGEYLLNYIFNNKDSEGKDASEYTANTREQYKTRYQEGLTYMLGIAFSLSNETLLSIANDLSNLGLWVVLGLLSDETGQSLADFLKPYVVKDGITVDDAEFLFGCNTLLKAVAYVFMQAVLLYAVETYRPSLTRLLYMHYPEVNYALLLEMNRRLK